MSHQQKSNKIVLIGQEGVGKTCLFERFRMSIFNEKHSSTVGASFCSHTTTVDERVVKLNVWDTAGQERFNTFLPMYVRDSSIVLICLDKPDIGEFHKYLNYCEEYSSGTKIYSVFTKCDLITDKKAYEDIEKIMREEENITEVWYTSSKTGENVSRLFENIAKYILMSPPSPIVYCDSEYVSIQDDKKETSTCSTCWS